MCSGASFLPAVTSRFSIVSAPGSSRKYAMSAKLSSTLPGMALLQLTLLFLVLGPFVGQRLLARLVLENAAPMLDERGGHRFQENPFRCRLNHGLRAVLNMELSPQPRGDDDLAFRREPDGISLCCCAHAATNLTF